MISLLTFDTNKAILVEEGQSVYVMIRTIRTTIDLIGAQMTGESLPDG